MSRVLAAELSRQWAAHRRYPVDFVGGLVILTTSFYALLLGARYISGPAAQFGDRVDALIVGYWLWTVLIFALANIAVDLQSEALTGTLEQLSLSQHGLTRLILIRALASLTFNIATTLTLLGSMLLLTGRRLSFPPDAVLPLAAVLCGAYGLALGLGALSLLFKRVQNLVQIAQFLLLFLVMAPVETFDGLARVLGLLLPVAPAAAVLRGLMAHGQPLDLGLFAVAAVNGLVYLAGGVWLFQRAERLARRRALLGQYRGDDEDPPCDSARSGARAADVRRRRRADARGSRGDGRVRGQLPSVDRGARPPRRRGGPRLERRHGQSPVPRSCTDA